MARAFSVLAVLPTFLALYRKFYANKKFNLDKDTTNDSTETTHLLPENEDTTLSGYTQSREHSPSDKKRIASQTASAAQELLVTRICFLIDAVGMILISLSRDSTGIMICECALFPGDCPFPYNFSLKRLLLVLWVHLRHHLYKHWSP